MNGRRTISLFLVLTMCLSTAACSTTATVDLRSDPGDSPTRERFEAGEPVEVVGYTRVSDGHRDWRGFVQLAPPDSVAFTPSWPGTKSHPNRSFKLLQAEIAAVDVVGASSERRGSNLSPADQIQLRGERSHERALTITLFVAIAGAMAIGYAVSGK